MSTQLMNLPINIPWKLIAASPDMLDTKFCNKQFPFAWRSSLAISAYEPKQEDLPEELCDERLTYLKVTCTITGYQPSKEETDLIYNSFSDSSTEDQRQAIDRIISEYFACYGALLNVAVFPPTEYEHYLEEFKSISFERDIQKITQLPNPFVLNEVTFTAADQSANRTVDQYPAGGDLKVELDLFRQMEVTIPLSFEVRAAVVHYSSKPVVMKAYKGNALVGTQTSGLQQGQVHDLKISKEGGIDRIVFESPGDKSSLLSLSLFHRLARPLDAPIEKLPRIVDFEPKIRDLYQAATDTGEVLTASVSGIKTDKSFSHTESSETGLNIGVGVAADIGGIGLMSEAGLSHKWGETDQDTSTVQTDASRERRESHGTTTNLNQMYNLLTGYHPGTNRAVFLMLPRPHILQSTDRRSFIQGVRIIEGVQDFFLIVSRPKTVTGLCVEAFLETGHFPEDLNIIQPSPEYEYKNVDFEHGPFRAEHPYFIPFEKRGTKNINGTYSSGFEDDVEGWHFDSTQGKPGRGGVDELEKYPDDNADGTSGGGTTGYKKKNKLDPYSFKAESSNIIIDGKITSGVFIDTIYHRKFRVYLCKQKQVTAASHADIARLIITSRGLCTCFKSVKNCFEIMSIGSPPSCDPKHVDWIVDEVPIKISGGLLTQDGISKTRLPAIKELLRKIQSAMSTSWRLPNRKPFGNVCFLDSDYFKDRIKAVLPKEQLGRPLKDIKGLSPSVVDGLGEDCTIDDALKLDLHTLMRKTGLTVCEAANARRTMLGIKPKTVVIVDDIPRATDSPKHGDPHSTNAE